MKLIKYYILAFLLIIQFPNVYSEEEDSYIARNLVNDYNYFSAHISYGFNTDYTDYFNLPGIFTCSPGFSHGKGQGMYFAIMYHKALVKQVSAILRFSYQDLSPEFTTYQDDYFIRNNEVFKAKIEHKLTTSISSVGIELGLDFRPVDNFNVIFSVQAGIPAKKEFEQVENLIEPVNYGTFENGLRYRNKQSGQIQEFSKLLWTTNFGLSYDILLNKRKTLAIAPEFYYSMQLNNIIESKNWHYTSFRFGLSLKFLSGYGLSTPLEPYN